MRSWTGSRCFGGKTRPKNKSHLCLDWIEQSAGHACCSRKWSLYCSGQEVYLPIFIAIISYRNAHSSLRDQSNQEQ